MPGSSYLFRLTLSGVGGILIALALLWLMQLMVINDNDQIMEKSKRPVMEFVRLKRPSETRLKQREKPKEPPPPDKPPPQLPELELAVTKPTIKTPNIAMAMPELATSSMRFDGPYIGAVSQGPPDRDFLVLSRIPPRYPYRAERKKIEGWVKVSFIITEQGSVQDAVVIDAQPKRVFDMAALQAILKWRFKPRISNGKPVATRADQIINFKLSKRRQ
ncbi:MAG: energy transducer TonB [Candidatus Polarisedimenticolaceae bacterium]|nr:energy transducer TonB [Candidatus Polarisedimenticolaceae bacterium]